MRLVGIGEPCPGFAKSGNGLSGGFCLQGLQEASVQRGNEFIDGSHSPIVARLTLPQRPSRFLSGHLGEQHAHPIQTGVKWPH